MVRDLTKGKPEHVVCTFSMPLLISVIFQQIYNISDSIIVGNFAANGEDALAAVGASYPITMLFVAVAVGTNSGCTVVLSRFFGAGRYESLKSAASTSLISASVLSVIMMSGGIVFCRQLLDLVNTPSNIYNDSATYLNIYIAGFIFLFIYNISNGIFTATGDTVTPLVFLIGSSFVNIVLDLWFVAGLHWDVAGAAVATLISQMAAAALSLTVSLRRLSKLKSGKFRLFSTKMLSSVAGYAVPGILQQSFVSVGNMFVQGLINSFGSSVVAGYSAAIKLNTLCVSSIAAFGGGVSNFTSQNIGAGRHDRIPGGLRGSLVFTLIITVIIGGVFVIFPSQAISLFVNKGEITPAALGSGTAFLSIVSWFYPFVAVKLMCDGVLRGKGRMVFFMITTFSDLVIRVILAYVLSDFFGSTGIWMSWPVGWIASMILSVVFYIVDKKSNINGLSTENVAI